MARQREASPLLRQDVVLLYLEQKEQLTGLELLTDVCRRVIVTRTSITTEVALCVPVFDVPRNLLASTSHTCYCFF